jgi:hypothetical protein
MGFRELRDWNRFPPHSARKQSPRLAGAFFTPSANIVRNIALIPRVGAFDSISLPRDLRKNGKS